MTELKIRDLCFGYHTKQVLKKVNLEVSESGLLCILGPNGVGKTTLARCIDKLLNYTSGSITLDGTELKDISAPELARKIAFVPNNAFSTFAVSVSECILAGRYPISGRTTTDEDLDAVDEAITLMGLQEFADKDIRELSAGQRQRVMIARGLVQDPEILILDEPTSNLDVKYQMEVMSFLKEFARERGIIVIAVCHDLNITAAYADRIAIMHDGAVFADGTPSKVLTEDNIRRAYDIETRVTEVDGIPHISLIPASEKKLNIAKSALARSSGILDSIRRSDRKFACVFLVVAILLGLCMVAYNLSDDDDDGLLGHEVTGSEIPLQDSRLWVYGNANMDDRIDSHDITYLNGVLGGTEQYTPLCDANLDGRTNHDDVEYLQKIINAMSDHTISVDVYYIDNYMQNQKVSWPVNKIAIGYCTGAYAALITGLSDKVVAVDDTISGFWKVMSPKLDKPSFGAVELGGASYEAIVSSNADVYVTGYLSKTIDPVTRDRLGAFGIDTMAITTADNDGIKNDYIDRSTVMFGFLLQGDMARTYEYLEWHDKVVAAVEANAALISNRVPLMETHVTSADITGTFKITGHNQTNNIHAEQAGLTAVGEQSQYLQSTYTVLNEETILSIIGDNSVDNRMWFVYNCQDGFRNSVPLSTLVAYHFPIGVNVNYLGLAREAGSTGMYVVEMAFYQKAVYNMDLEIDGTTWTYVQLFDHFVHNFLDPSLSPDITKFFLQ